MTLETDGRHTWGGVLWRQLGAAIDMFDDTLAACPDELWTGRLWAADDDPDTPPRFGEFWTIATHAIRWLERYLLAVGESEFAGLATSTTLTPFPGDGGPQSKSAVRGCLAELRGRCETVLTALTDEEARRPISVYQWVAGEPLVYLELQIYNLRHVQEHTAQLALFLGQHGVPGERFDWVARAR